MTVQNQIIRKTCSVCGEFIFLSPNIISSLGNKVPLNANGQPHDSLHKYIHKKHYKSDLDGNIRVN